MNSGLTPVEEHKQMDFISQLLPAERELEKPLELNELQSRYSGFGKASHPYIKDGIYLKPGLSPALASQLSKCILLAVNEVKDEHFPKMGFVAASFLRMVALTTVSNQGRDAIQIDLYFRFTVDNCPAGERSFEKIRDSLTNKLVTDLKAEPELFVINVMHGGSPHQIEDINDASFRAMFQVVMSGCDPKCADFKSSLLASLKKKSSI